MGKYDTYWLERLPVLLTIIDGLRPGGKAVVDCSSILTLGSRKSWAGHSTIAVGAVIKSDGMVHVRSLAKVLAPHTANSAGLTYELRMDNSATLTIGCDPTSEAGRQARGGSSLSRDDALSAEGALLATTSCVDLHRWAWSLHRYFFPFDESRLPRDGLYLLFERGETGHGGERIVRVGTHREDGRLADRLETHFKGNRGSSIVRKHVGAALLVAHSAGERERALWESHSTAMRVAEAAVSTYVRESLTFVAVPLPGGKHDRLTLEERWIRLLSECPGCRPSPRWLGFSSPSPALRASGLWNVQHVQPRPSIQLAAVPPRGKTLVVIPCSKDKVLSASPLFAPDRYSSVLDLLPTSGAALARARSRLGGRAIVPESPPGAALDYYSGRMYSTPGLKQAVFDATRVENLHFVILSGCYGILLPEEPIRNYELLLKPGEWKRAGIGASFAELCRSHCVSRVVGFAGSTTAYARVMEELPWSEPGLAEVEEAGYVAPVGGGQRGVPMALGSALLQFLRSGGDLQAVLGERHAGLAVVWRRLK